VTNGEFLAFVRASGYRPTDPANFLRHLAHLQGTDVPPGLLRLPVTYVSLADARAYATAQGERLPTEAEWQWAAEGAGLGNAYPWGEGERPVTGELREPDGATPQGVLGLSGNAWELTESEHTDGHTRFVMLRGGVFLPPGESEWLVARGARRNDSHAKYILLADGIDRSAAISFRTVIDLT
jgi:formylglycine-generating enzyme required for sulfatase activity